MKRKSTIILALALLISLASVVTWQATGGDFYSIVYSVADGTITLTADWVSTYTFTDLASGPQCQ